jgi:hypothetical protein
MIHPVSAVIEDDTCQGEEVTVSCNVLSGPKRGGRGGGQKTLYDIDLSDTEYSGEAFLSIWHEKPPWTDDFGKTATYIEDLLDDLPLQEHEKVLARGVPNVNEGKWYFNVTSILLRDPHTTIGKSEMRSADECPRIYNLAFEKNIYSPGRYDLSAGSIKGRIVHTLLEYAVSNDRYRKNFETGWSEAEMEACFSDIVEDEYSMELALCRLAWVSTNRINENAWDAVTALLKDQEFTRRIAEAEDFAAEVGLSTSLGFNGRVDLLIDGVPYDLKTVYQPSEAQREKNRFQLRIYLLALALESLSPGETFEERLSGGVEGVLVYPNLADRQGVELEHVRLRKQDIQSILQLRNEAVVLRDGFGVSTTYGRDCEGCRFKEPTEVVSGDTEHEELPAPCQFYCQSERRWDCFESDEEGNILTQCPLFDQCDQRLQFRNPQITDHYNQLRSALNAEREARRSVGTELEHLDRDTLVQTGLLLPGLSLTTVEGHRRLYFEPDEHVVPSFSPGDEICLQHSGSDYYQSAIYYGKENGAFVFQLDTTPTPSFLDPTTTFEARRTISVETYPRQLLSQLDYAQRAEVTPLLESKGSPGDALEELSADEVTEVDKHLDNKELYVNIPIRPDRTQTVTELVSAISTASLPKVETDESIASEEQRILVLSSSPDVTDAISEHLPEKEGTIRMDGFAGGEATTITPVMDGHEIYSALEDSNVILSSTRYALTENTFHSMRSGDPEARSHSDRFFDAVVLVGADRLTEPQFHFLRVLGDRVFAVGDTHRTGPEMMSGEARESRLNESYFNRVYRRFANVENPDSQSMVVPGELTEQMKKAFSNLDIPITSFPGEVDFIQAQGTAMSAIDQTTFEYRFPCDTKNKARFLRLKPVENVDAPQISRAFEKCRTIDADEFTIRETYTIQDIQFEVKTNNPVDGEEHQVKVQVPVETTPFLNKLLTHNPGEADAVADLCTQRDVDAVVTPFVAHANTLRAKLAKRGIDVSVYLPEELSGEQFDSTIVSLGISDERRMVVPPVNDVETLYTILNSGREVTLVGDRQTLERNSIITTLL